MTHNGWVLAKCQHYKLKFKEQTICGILPILCWTKASLAWMVFSYPKDTFFRIQKFILKLLYMTFKKENYTTTLVKAKTLVPGFREAFSRFEERLVLDQCSKSMFSNYSRNLAHLALHFGRVPHNVSLWKNDHQLVHKYSN